MATLITRAETAQDIAAGLNKFLNPVPEHSAEIAALISECFAISSVLRELSSATGDPRYAWNLNLISQDLGVTLTSLKYVSWACGCGLSISSYVKCHLCPRALDAQVIRYTMQLDAYPGMELLTSTRR